ncbi:macrophage mannose receptor 1-like protein [Leptotrombidium deliense]|uniref:Macrophage mannose receptor 1-like protein n=1 Tax=Leptotrombidium deliense TaxID=299467 RepID=A0A443S415_9ACAR|nr:macrophage mannose receptor 1-like protein [Leptotrombidium deliense]
MQSICSDKGATTVSIHSAEEETFLRSIVGYGKYHWLGAQRVQIGRNEFVWTDGSKFDYEHWKSNQPNQLFQERSSCVSVFTDSTFLWFDDNCDLLRSQLCQKAATKTDVEYIEIVKSTMMPQIEKLLSRNFNETNTKLETKIKALENVIELYFFAVYDMFMENRNDVRFNANQDKYNLLRSKVKEIRNKLTEDDEP